MQALSNHTKNILTYTLIAIGVLAIGLLIYIVVDRLSSPAAPAVVQTPSEDTVVTTDPETNNDAPVDIAEATDIPIGIRIGQRAPDFLLSSLDNESVALSDYHGHVVILDFWASWCSPCKATMPGLEALAQAYAPDVVLLGVSLDQTAAKASKYLEDNNYDAIIALYGTYAAAQAVSQTYAVSGIPKTYVIDRSGVIRYVGHPASLPRQTVEGLI